MPGWDPPDAPTLGNPIPKTWGQKVLDCLLWLYGQIGSSSPSGIPNGSAEIDSDADGIPDNWDYDDYPGGTGGIDTSTPAHGAAGFYCTHPGGAGNGGRAWESDYVEISEDISPLLMLFLWATAAGMKVIVRFKYYDKAKSHISDEDIYSSTSNPTTRTAFTLWGIPPATARYLKVVLIGGYTDTDVAGTVYFDGLVFDAMPRMLYGNYTITEGSHNNTTFTDVGSVAITVPKGFTIAFLPVSITNNNVPTGTRARYRVSTTYSTEFVACSTDSGYPQNDVELDISAISGSQTLYLQVADCSAGYTSYGKKDNSRVTYIRE
jgi:hypothetical protein